jgi:hypothetical protein
VKNEKYKKIKMEKNHRKMKQIKQKVEYKK